MDRRSVFKKRNQTVLFERSLKRNRHGEKDAGGFEYEDVSDWGWSLELMFLGLLNWAECCFIDSSEGFQTTKEDKWMDWLEYTFAKWQLKKILIKIAMYKTADVTRKTSSHLQNPSINLLKD